MKGVLCNYYSEIAKKLPDTSKKIAVFTYVEPGRVLPLEIISRIQGFDGLSARSLYFAALAALSGSYDEVIVCFPLPPLRAEVERLREISGVDLKILVPYYTPEGEIAGFCEQPELLSYRGVNPYFESEALAYLLTQYPSSSLVHFSYYDTGVGGEYEVLSGGDARLLCNKLKFRQLMEQAGLGKVLLPAAVFLKGERIDKPDFLEGKFIKLPEGTSGEGTIPPEEFKEKGMTALVSSGLVNEGGVVLKDFYVEEDARGKGNKCRQISVKFLKFPDGSLQLLSIHTNIEDNFKHLGVVIPSSPNLLGIDRALDRLLEVSFSAARVVGEKINFGEINFDCVVVEEDGNDQVFITDPNIRSSNSSVGVYLAALVGRKFQWLSQVREQLNTRISNLQQAEEVIKGIYENFSNAFPYATSTIVESLVKEQRVDSYLLANIS